MHKWKILSQENELKNVVTTLLKNRGFVSDKEQKLFLSPPSLQYWVEKLSEDFISSLKLSKSLIQKAISENTPIVIHGDYDVDGITATAILFSSIREDLSYGNVFAFIPNRFAHGYGLSEKSIEATISLVEKTQKVEKILFVTVDSGITSIDEIALIKKMGHDIIVTDHHQKSLTLPEADAILWNDLLVGGSIAWLLSRSLGVKNNTYLSYACLATVTDLQPLTNFNRSVVKYGLEQINRDVPLAFSELLQIAGKKDKEITTYDLGWLIGPRLNASGRVGDAIESLDLLVEKDPDVIKKLAWDICKTNTERQDKTFEMYEIAAEFEGKDLPAIIVSHNENYHEGIIGLVASRITQKYNRPTVVISTAEKVAKGSVRSISSINIIEVLRNYENLFESLGGHPMAAGFSIKKENIKELQESLRKYGEENITDEDLEKVLDVDLEIPSSIISEDLLNEFDKLEPYGVGNNEPVLVSRNLGISSIDKVGREGNHLSLRFIDGDNFYKGIFFNHGFLYEDYQLGDLVDIAFSLKRNEYNGKVYIDLIIKDIKKST